MTARAAEAVPGAPAAPGWRWYAAGRNNGERNGYRADGWSAGVKWLPFKGCYMVTVAMPGSDDHWPVARVSELADGIARAAAVADAAAMQLRQEFLT